MSTKLRKATAKKAKVSRKRPSPSRAKRTTAAKRASVPKPGAVEREMRGMRQALREVRERLVAVEAALDAISSGPVERFVEQVVRSLEDGPWGEALSELRAVSERENHEGLQALDLFEQIQALATALFAALGIRPYPVGPKIRNLSTRLAETYRWADDRPIPPVDRCRFEVLCPGWKRGDTVLIPPKIRLADRPAPRSPTPAANAPQRAESEAPAGPVEVER